MKTHFLLRFFLVTAAVLFLSFALRAQTFYVDGVKQNSLKVTSDSYYKTSFESTLAKFSLRPVQTEKGTFVELDIENYAKTYALGKPQLPSRNELIEVPHGADFKIKVLNFDYQDFDLNSKGINHKLMPAQPSYSKSTDAADITFYFDEDFYAIDNFFQEPLVAVEASGIVRGVRMAHLKVSPFAYNPARNILRVYKNISFEVTYDNPQVALSHELKEKYYSPVFDAVHSRLLNFKPLAQKGYLSSYPIKYVIVSDPMFETILQPFVTWKTKKGFEVVEAYTNNPQVGTTTGSIKNYLEGLYQAAAPGNPAPSYVLFVGDVAQIPAFSGTTGTHVTDLYYCEYDGGNDYMPDVYYGRFSANNISQLLPQVEKTLLYEQYDMYHQNFLDTAVLVAGVDNNFAMVHGNGQINYLVDNYFNASQGIFAHTYFYPASASAAAQIRADIYKGVGVANYTAHCNYNGWGEPSFTNTHVPNMAEGKFSLVVSNCCLPNKFDEPECFGEALLRADNKGAIGHIGASNNTYWDEDYWWAVGYTSSIVQNPAYAATGLGSFDRLFHTHGEPESEWFIANGQISYAGNFAVEASNTSRKKYYWEVYHLMGDPSLMTYLRKPSPLTAIYTNPIVVGETNLTIQTEPYAYAAISHQNVLLNAAKADSTGLVVLNFTPFLQPDTADIVITKQNKVPFIGTLYIVGLHNQIDAAPIHILQPESYYSCAGITVQPKVVIRNYGLTDINSLEVKYRLNSGNIQTVLWTGQLQSLETDTVLFPPFTLVTGQHSLKVFTSLPNNTTDENNSNDTIMKTFTVADLQVQALFTTVDSVFCNAPATVTFVNQSEHATSYLWNFGDGVTSTATQPTHTFNNIGVYQVTLTADAGICGSNTYQLPHMLSVGLPAPHAVHAQSCSPASLTLSSTGYDSIYWYYNPGDTLAFHQGNTFTTPFLDTSTTYYVQGAVYFQPQFVGKLDNSGAGGYFGNQTHWHYLIFDAHVSFTLTSVKVYANSEGTRTILLRDNAENIIQSADIFLPLGESRINLNFNVPVGNDLQLVGAGNVDLYRNTNNTASYPYELPGVVTITESSASLPQYNAFGNYYYFYDWEVEQNNCVSTLQAVTAHILDTPVAHFTHQVSGYTVNFTNLSDYAIDVFWDFGDGTNTTLLNPTHTYNTAGTYNVKLLVENICGVDSVVYQLVLQGLAPETDFIASPTSITEGDTVYFTDLSLYTPHTWNWIFEGGTPFNSQLQHPAVVYNTPGVFYVTLIADNDFGSGYAHKSQYVYVGPSSVYEVFDTEKVFIYPNPVIDNKLFVDFKTSSQKIHVQIFNIFGAESISKLYENSSSPLEIQLDGLSAGIYLLRYSSEKLSKNFKFIIQ